MSQRFFSETPITGPTAELTGGEARHLAGVLRAEPGDEVVLFDGSASDFRARVMRIGRSSVTLEILERREPSDRQEPLEVHLAVALPKGDRQKWLVEKATELGVTRLVPLVAERSVAQPVDKALERLRRTVVEACKQCGRNRLLQIERPRTVTELLDEPPAGALRWFAHPGSADPPRPPESPAAVSYLAIGPEGGFTDNEAAQARAAGWQLVQLGPRLLRVETAALALAARLTLPV